MQLFINGNQRLVCFLKSILQCIVFFCIVRVRMNITGNGYKFVYNREICKQTDTHTTSDGSTHGSGLIQKLWNPDPLLINICQDLLPSNTFDTAAHDNDLLNFLFSFPENFQNFVQVHGNAFLHGSEEILLGMLHANAHKAAADIRISPGAAFTN